MDHHSYIDKVIFNEETELTISDTQQPHLSMTCGHVGMHMHKLILLDEFDCVSKWITSIHRYHACIHISHLNHSLCVSFRGQLEFTWIVYRVYLQVNEYMCIRSNMVCFMMVIKGQSRWTHYCRLFTGSYVYLPVECKNSPWKSNLGCWFEQQFL